MQFIDLKAQQKQIREKVNKRIQKVLDHGKYIMGPEVFEFEDKLAKGGTGRRRRRRRQREPCVAFLANKPFLPLTLIYP